jgi:hypothetical protein
MKRRSYLAGLLGIVAAAVGCAGPSPGTTSVSVAGVGGSRVIGHYVQNGKRVAVDQAVPLSLSVSGLSELEVRKADPDGKIVIAAQYDDDGWHSETVSDAGLGVAGLRLRVRNGVELDRLSR